MHSLCMRYSVKKGEVNTVFIFGLSDIVIRFKRIFHKGTELLWNNVSF